MKQFFALLIAAPIVALAAIPAAHAQTAKCATPGADNAFLGIQTIRLWPGTPPQAKGDSCNDIPALTVFSPRQGTGNGSAVVIFPGGVLQERIHGAAYYFARYGLELAETLCAQAANTCPGHTVLGL